MADPNPYNPSYSFTGYQTINPNRPLPAPRIDTEYANISAALNGTQIALKDIRRSDGKLKNGIVTTESLAPGLNVGFVFRGVWTANTSYFLGDVVGYGVDAYRANIAHKSVSGQTPDARPDLWSYVSGLNSLWPLADETTPDTDTTHASTPADVIRRIISQADFVNVKNYGAVLDGTADDTQAFRDAAATGRAVYLPTGDMLLTDMVTLQPGQKLFGDGNEYSTIRVKPSFNMAALGVLRMGTAEPGPEVYDIGFIFEQDQNAASRAAVNQYPPAIYAQNVPRFVLDRIRIEGAWDGIDARGNAGGSYIGYVEIGALNKGVQIDGALDFFKGGFWHFWPFGFQNGGTPLGGLYRDGNTVALECGTCDNLAVGIFQTFRAKVVFTAIGSPPLLWHQIGSLAMDGNGARLVVGGHNISVGQLYSTKNGGTEGPDIDVTGGRLTVGQWERIGSTVGVPALSVSGNGQFFCYGGFWNQSGAGERFALLTGGLTEIRGVRLEIPGVARTLPYIEQTAGVLTINGCTVPRGPASGEILKIGADNAGHFISDNEFGLMTCNLPVGAVTGYYNINKRETFTPAPSFATPGTSAFNVTQASGNFRRAGNEVEFWIVLLFDITSIAGASGSFRVTGLPINLIDNEPLIIGQMDMVGFSAAGFISAQMGTTGIATFLTQATTAGAASMTTTEFAVRNGYILRLRGRARIRN